MTRGRKLAAFRVDASLLIGTGHVMRCLTLADVLSSRGVECHFVCRELPGNLAPMIGDRGFACHVLDMPPFARDDGTTPHSHWLTVAQQTDAEETLGVLKGLGPDWLVVDHYALDATWETAVRPAVGRVLVVDDLADRPHDCDILLDQSPGRDPSDYRAFVPDACRLLVSPRFALLRPEFASCRDESLARRAAGQLRGILVSMGGVDKDDATGRVLEALAASGLPRDCTIVVLLGRTAPWKDAVVDRARAMPVATRVEVDAKHVARLLLEADLAIGAAGSSALERCCLGLPTLVVSIAANQEGIARALDAAGAATFVGSPFSGDFAERLSRAIGRLSDPGALRLQQRAAAAIVDGRGASRVADAMLAGDLAVRPATAADAGLIHAWRYAGNAERWYRHSEVPSLEAHVAWFDRALRDPQRLLLVVESNGSPVAHVRLDRDAGDPAAAHVGICVSPSMRGRGRSADILGVALARGEELGFARFLAEVHDANLSSRRLFERLGFREGQPDGSFRTYILDTRLAEGRAASDDRSKEPPKGRAEADED